MSTDSPLNQWDEETSKRYIDYGRYFVPAREQHMHIMVDLLKGLPLLSRVLELCSGEGLPGDLFQQQGMPCSAGGNRWSS